MQFERRKPPRVKCTLTSKFRDPNENSSAVLSSPAIIEDISTSGVRLRLRRFLPLATLLHLKIFLSQDMTLQVQLKPMWISELPKTGEFQIGAEFVDIREVDKKAIQNFIHQILIKENE